MEEVPVRLVVVKARVPTGDTCKGCDFEEGYQHSGLPKVRTCGDLTLALNAPPRPLVTNGMRLPACKERDAYRAIAPNSPEAKLL